AEQKGTARRRGRFRSANGPDEPDRTFATRGSRVWPRSGPAGGSSSALTGRALPMPRVARRGRLWWIRCSYSALGRSPDGLTVLGLHLLAVALRQALACTAGRDLDTARLVLLGLRQVQHEHTVVDRRRDLLGVKALRDLQCALEAAETALESHPAMGAVLAGLSLIWVRALAADRQGTIDELDLDVINREAGQVHVDRHRLIGPDHIGSRNIRPHDVAAREHPVELTRE